MNQFLKIGPIGVAFWLVAGCGGEGGVARRAPDPDAGTQLTPDAAEEPPPIDAPANLPTQPREAGVIKRTVLHRSPFGNLQRTDNLLVDGDFEWVGMPYGAGQTPWVAISMFSQQPLVLETGGICRSGLRCVRIDSSVVLLGDGISATSGMMQASLWAKVPGAKCDVLTAFVLPAMTLSGFFSGSLVPDAEAPDDQSWCHYSALVEPPHEAVAMYITAEGLQEGETAIVDDAVLRPVDGMSPLQLRSRKPSDAQLKRALAAMSWMRTHRRF